MEDLAVVGTTLNSMPELPEVQTVKTILERFVPGHKILGIEVLRDSIISGDKEEFVNSLVGEQFLSLSRIGKYLIFHLTNDKVIISHLRMEGKYYEYNEDEDAIRSISFIKKKICIFHIKNDSEVHAVFYHIFDKSVNNSKNKKALETTLFLWFPPSMGDPYFFFNSSLWGEYGEAGREVNKPKACVIPSEAWESRSYYVAIRHLLQFVHRRRMVLADGNELDALGQRLFDTDNTFTYMTTHSIL